MREIQHQHQHQHLYDWDDNLAISSWTGIRRYPDAANVTDQSEQSESSESSGPDFSGLPPHPAPYWGQNIDTDDEFVDPQWVMRSPSDSAEDEAKPEAYATAKDSHATSEAPWDSAVDT